MTNGMTDQSLRIVADENIPYVDEFFSSFGSVTKLPGRNMTSEDVRDADVLLVRSVTRVNENLLADSRVKFVGTCTIGVDHLDRDWMQTCGIQYASAPGCNANSVAEYVFSVLARLRPDWLQRSFGIVGCGNVGGALYKTLKALGLPVRFYDPLLQIETGDHRDPADSVSLEQVLAADVVAMHAPFTEAGPFPSRHLIGAEQLSLLKPGALLINAGRGPVVDNVALSHFLQSRSDIDVALDVWEHEPLVDMDLLRQVSLGSPHIAGYSFDGKVEGTAMIYRALCRFVGIESLLTARQCLPDQNRDRELRAETTQSCLNEAILGAYDVLDDDRRMRERLGAVELEASSDSMSEAFDAMRKSYPVRREFFTNCVVRSEWDDPELWRALKTLGFALAMKT